MISSQNIGRATRDRATAHERALWRVLRAVLAGVIAVTPLAVLASTTAPATAADGVVSHVVSTSAAFNGTTHSLRVPTPGCRQGTPWCSS